MSPNEKDPGADSTIRDSTPGATQPMGELRPGMVLAQRYRVVEYIGRGGMGSVYRAHDLTLGADIAIKTLDPELIQDAARLDAFRGEVKLARLVTHRNVCRCHDIVETPGLTFITMELIEGESLRDFLSRKPEPTLRWTLDRLRDVCRGLAAAHGVGVIHRDLKPGNVLLTEGGERAVVADFGIAAQATRYGKTEVGLAGTRGYMSPEQAAGLPLDTRSDVYALGVLAYLMATGRLPSAETGEGAEAASPGATTVSTSAAATDAPTLEDVPAELFEFVTACLRQNPEDRPADATAALRLLETSAALAGEPTVVSDERRRPPEGPRDASAGRTLVVGLAVVALVGLVSWGIGRLRRGPVDLRLSVGEVGAPGLEAREAWLADALEQRLVNELNDAYGIDARKGDPDAARVTGTLERDASGRLHATLELEGEALRRVEGDSLRQLAERAATGVAAAAFPANRLRPTAEDLAAVGTTDVEAWRLLWRARREARMHQWETVRELLGEALEHDPGFAVAWMEIAFTHDPGDRAYAEAAERAGTLAAARPGMSELSRQGIQFALAVAHDDADGAKQALADLETIDVEAREQLYVQSRWAWATWRADRMRGEAKLEWIAEQFPNDAGAYKQLTSIYVDSPFREERARAVSRGARAVELAPDDVALRADYARALALEGDRDAARAQMEILETADPAAKQSAFSGGELFNRLYELHLAMGEYELAERDVLRLMRGDSAVRRAQGQYGLGLLQMQRGAVEAGLDNCVAAAKAMSGLGMNGLAGGAYARAALAAWEAGHEARAAQLYEVALQQRPDDARSRWRLAFLQARAAGADNGTGAAERFTALEPPDDGDPWGTVHALILAHERQQWEAVGVRWRTIERRLTDITALDYAARAAAARGDAVEAERLYAMLVEHPARWQHPVPAAHAWLQLGRLRQTRGDEAGARSAYESFLRQWSQAPGSDPAVVQAQAKLAALRESQKVK